MNDELLWVPLIVVGPGFEARKVDTPVSLIDLGPTVLDMFGQPTPGTFFGETSCTRGLSVCASALLGFPSVIGLYKRAAV